MAPREADVFRCAWPRLLALVLLAGFFGGVSVVSAPLVFALGEDEGGAAAAAARAKEKRTFTIAWAGDITLGSHFGTPPQAARSLFKDVRGPLRDADMALGNLEGALSASSGTSKCVSASPSCFSFIAPPAHAGALRSAGFDAVNLANNHAFDAGAGGQGETIAALERQRIGFTGRPGEIRVIRRGSARVALVGFAPYPWANDVRDLAWARSLVQAASRKADVTVVLAHVGGEGSDQTSVPEGNEAEMGEDRGDTRAFAHAVVDAGADLVLGSGPHVLRGMELYRGRLVAYSLGNFAGWHNFSTHGSLSLSGLLTVRLTEDGALRGGRFDSLRLDGAGVPHPDPSGESRELVNRLGREDFGAAALRLLPDGSF